MPRVALLRLMALVGVFLIIGVVFCVFDHVNSSDLCLMSLTLLGSTLALSPLPVVGWLELSRVLIYPSVLVELPSPPPRV